MLESRRLLISLLSIVLVLSLVPTIFGASVPDPIIDLGFNEGTGTTTANSGSAGGEFTLSTPSPTWSDNVPPGGGTSSLDFGTTANGYYVESPEVISELGGLEKFTVTLWANCTDSTTGAGGNRLVCWKAGAAGDGAEFVYLSTGGMHMAVNEWPDWPNNRPTKSSEGMIPTDAAAGADNWRFIAITYDSTLSSDQVTYYFGTPSKPAAKDVSDTYPEGGVVGTNIQPLTIGNFAAGDRGLTGRQFRGLIDEVKIFGDVLTPEQIQSVQAGTNKGRASTPNPANDANDISRDVLLSWTPGTVGGKSDVYFGTSFEDVNDGTALANPGQDANSYDPGRLEFGTTYFWRVDDINAVDSTVTAGTVWSFTVEPYSIEIPGDEITVSASTSKAGNPPSRLVDGSGLTQMSHSTAISGMWVSSPTDTDPWLLFEFDRTKELDKMLLWNSNSEIEDIIGMGVKDVNILTSIDGENWTALSSVQVLQAPIPITADYNTPQEIDLGLAVAKYVKINILSNWGGASTSVSEVKFFTIPLEARQPLPGDGALDVAHDSTLQWRAGREAGEHNVYLSTDEQSVIDGTSAMVTIDEPVYSPPTFDVNTTYYWRVDEVNNGENPSLWTGPVWSFTTTDTIVVDDFESYNDEEGQGTRIYENWIDGYGINDNGSQVGYLNAPFAEKTIVYSGMQSMPLSYEGTNSHADLALANEDWTRNGVTTLVIHFYGTPDNTGQLYVKINDTKIPYTGDANDIATESWTTWKINLASSGASLTNVSSLTIGIDDGSGLLYIDDVLLK